MKVWSFMATFILRKNKFNKENFQMIFYYWLPLTFSDHLLSLKPYH
jgi:hypothetical protein